jgi:tetratricopeptide repeat protein
VEGRAMEAESGQLLLDFDAVELNRLLEFRVRDNGQADRDKKLEAERWFQRGLELEQAGGPIEQVVEAYEKSLELDASSAGALVNLGTIHFNAHDWKKAERYYLRALEADPEYALAHFDLANLYDERGEQKKALEHYRAAHLAALRRCALQPGAAISGGESTHEGGASLDGLSEAGSGQPLVQHRTAGARETAASRVAAGVTGIEGSVTLPSPRC